MKLRRRQRALKSAGVPADHKSEAAGGGYWIRNPHGGNVIVDPDAVVCGLAEALRREADELRRRHRHARGGAMELAAQSRTLGNAAIALLHAFTVDPLITEGLEPIDTMDPDVLGPLVADLGEWLDLRVPGMTNRPGATALVAAHGLLRDAHGDAVIAKDRGR